MANIKRSSERFSPLSQSSAARFASRALHLVDLENLVGGSQASDATIRAVWDAYSGGLVRSGADHVIVGTGPGLAERSWWLLPSGVQRRMMSGLDGGERSLISTVDIAAMSQRFGRLVIASGDHEFVHTAIAARTHGMLVHQVTGIGAASGALLAASTVRSRLRLEDIASSERLGIAA